MDNLEKYCKNNNIDFNGMSEVEKKAFGQMIKNTYGFQVTVLQYAYEELVNVVKTEFKKVIDKRRSN